MKRARLVAIAVSGLVAVIAAPAFSQVDPPTDGHVGVIGCSNTDNAVSGYHDVSDAHVLWHGDGYDDPNDDHDGVLEGYRSKSLREWADVGSSKFNIAWGLFDEQLAAHPDTVAIWWQFCTGPDSEHPIEQVDTVYALIRQRTNVPIYASPLDRSPSCTPGNPDLGEEFVEYLVDNGWGYRGPILTPLTYPGEMRDNCHANEVGDDIWGTDLAEFFEDGFVPGPGGGGADFLDVPPDHTFYAEINWMRDEAITLGCDANGLYYCPADPVTRAQMASFLDRAFDLPDTSTDYFTDDEGSTHEAAINRVAAAGISLGCDATGTLFCPANYVSRAQMASFIARAADGLSASMTDYFSDDDDNIHEDNINILAENEITLGCSSTDPTLYCPFDSVSRGQMAAFIKRTVDAGGA